MKPSRTVLAWLVGLGTIAVAGVGIYLYEKSRNPPPPALPASST